MAYFEIRGLGSKAQVFPLEGFQVTIGRSEEMDLVLPNVSVSRRHCMLIQDEGGWIIGDQGSENGFLVNGDRFENHRLESGDRVQIGKFILVFHGDDTEREDPSARLLMPEYNLGGVVTDEEHTFTLKSGDLKRIMQSERMARGATIVSMDNPGDSFLPGERETSIGPKGDIPALGWGARAKISWNRRTHVVKTDGVFSTVTVNGASVAESELYPGDEFTVGRSRFKYVGPD